MKNSDKFVMFIYLILLTVFFGVFIIIPFGYISREYADVIFNNLFDTPYYAIAAGFLIILNIKLIVSLVMGERYKRVGVVKSTPGGEISISNETIKSLVIKTASQSRAIKDINVMIKPNKENISIMIKAQIMPDTNITETVKEIQENVKSYVESIAEIPVGEVKVIIADVAANTRLRLE